MSTKIYVGNLPYEWTGAELEQLFSQFGTVKLAEISTNRRTGRSRGFGFIEMSSPEETQAAIEGTHDREHGGRKLKVNESRPRATRASSYNDTRGGFGGFGGGRY